MPKEKFLLLSLKEEKAKKIAQVISNVTCRKILEYLADKEATETELAEKLNLPISTVHYNLQQLMDSNLVIVEEFHYSKKGKEVNHYKLANKYVIIAPKSTFGIKEKLRSILPVVGLSIIAATLLQFFTLKKPAIEAFGDVSVRALKTAEPMIEAAVEEVVKEVPRTIAQPSLWSSIALWFFIGALFSLIIYFVLDYVRKKREK